MKQFEITPETAFNFTKFSVAILFSWPPSENAGNRKKNIFNIQWWILWINSLLLVVPLIYTAYIDRQNILLLTKSLCFCTSCFQVNIKMLICKMMRKQMQFILDEMEYYVRNASPHDREIFLYYTKKCGLIHVSFLLIALGTILGILVGPFVLPQPFPTEAKYPFPVDAHPLFGIIYIQQSITGIQVVSMTAIDCQMAMMLWYIIARMKILEEETRKITNAYEFSICIQEHQYLLRLANEVTNIVRYILLTTVTMTTMAIILGGVHIVGNQPMIVKMQFTFVVSAYSVLVFLNAWPSEILMRSCEGIGTAMYESAWVEGYADKNIVLVIQRSRIPVVTTVAGLLPILSLNYYTTFLSKTFSFFTTLRIVLAKIESTAIS